jgi:hypothetical protein
MLAEPRNAWVDGIWRIKGSLLILFVIIAVGFVTTELTESEHLRMMGRFGFDYDTLIAGRLWQLLTGTWIQSSPGIELTMLLLVLGGTASLELLAGTPAMLITCISGDWVATVLTSLTLRLLVAFGNITEAGLLSTPDAGSSALAHAGYGAAVMLLPRRWLKIAIPVLIFLTAIQFWIVELAPAIVHCWATAYGAAIGWFVLRPRLAGGEHIAGHPATIEGDMLKSGVVNTTDPR